MRLTLIGGGALGALFAARLHHHGVDVAVVEPDEARRGRLGRGVRITGFRRLDAAVAPPVVGWKDAPVGPDALLLCVPPRAAAAALERAAVAFPDHPPLLSLVGGLGSLAFSERWPGEIVLGVTNLEVRTGPGGDPESGFHNFTWLGNQAATETDAMRALQHVLAWVAPTLTGKVLPGMVWSKAIFEVEAALPVLADAVPGAFYDADERLDLAAELVLEGIAVARSHGVEPIAFDFFDPNLYPAITPGEVGTRRAWMRHCWQRHEQFRVGAPAPFTEPAGLGALLRPEHPGRELEVVLEQLREAARARQVATPRLDALAAWLAGSREVGVVAALGGVAP